ncbi:MAG TPA: tetratricopeptide repeat protein [Nannocystaceae bacterium]|nr:tetratricopeptide repeat protein [Nannocystaceae bacterium]
MAACPDEHTLLRYASGELGPAWTERLDAHIDGCSACTELVAHAVRELGARPSAAEGEESELDEPPPLTSFDAMPDAIDRYVLLQRIGSGGMGTVWAAFDPHLDRRVALKVLRPGSIDRNRFLRQEARALAALTHPNVVQIFAVGSWSLGGRQPSIYLVMELVEGEDLRRWCARGRSDAEILEAFRQAGRGLAAAHAAGLVHRDFKPDNVLIDREGGRVRVTDFGLARTGPRDASSADATLTAGIVVEEVVATQAGVVMGTPAYMAPEQRDAASVDARADQYAFCVSLWEALTGARPDDDDFDGPRKLPPPRLRKALLCGLARDPEARFPDMDALLRALFDPPRSRAKLAAAFALSVPVVALAWTGAHARSEPAPGAVTVAIAPAIAARMALTEGNARRDAGRYDEARELQMRAHTIASAQNLYYVASNAAIQQVFLIGSIAGDYEGGVTWVRHAETAIARLPPTERPQAEADLATVRGHLFEAAGRLDDARSEFETMLDHLDRTQPLDHGDRVLTLTDLGRIETDRDPELALAYLASALEIAQYQFGEHHNRFSLVLANMGALHEHRGDIELAAEIAERVLAIEEGENGPEHPDVARASYNLAVLLDALGDDVAAESGYRRALTMWEAALGSDHPLVARCYDNLGGLFYEAGDLDGGEREYNRAMVLYEHRLGPDDEALITPLSGLTEIAILREQGARAVELSERALALAAKRSSEYRASMTFRAARALWAAGRRDEAFTSAKLAIDQSRANDDPMEEAGDYVPQIESWLAGPEGWRWPDGA